MSTRWSPEAKRGQKRQVEEKEMFRDSSIPRVERRPDHVIRQAAAWFAWDALEHGIGPYNEIEEILSMLGLDRPALEQQQDREEPCWPYAGSSRGLNIHFKSYTVPCASCTRVREERQRAERAAYGITHEGIVT